MKYDKEIRNVRKYTKKNQKKLLSLAQCVMNGKLYIITDYRNFRDKFLECSRMTMFSKDISPTFTWYFLAARVCRPPLPAILPCSANIAWSFIAPKGWREGGGEKCERKVWDRAERAVCVCVCVSVSGSKGRCALCMSWCVCVRDIKKRLRIKNLRSRIPYQVERIVVPTAY